jgi:NAD(P)-dependent dehydrogenase (short-subunit alcohol dehydrogenase family)
VTTKSHSRRLGNTLLLRANGHKATRAKKGARVDREKLRQIDLHWHDLRDEGACRLLADGATVFLADIDETRLERARQQHAQEFSADRVRAGKVDVTDEALVQASFANLIAEFGGVDILVSNAGIASSAPFEDITTDLWDRNSNIMSRGYFLVSREAFRIMKKQGNGGSIVFVASKNGLAASPKAAAYCTANAAELHLASCIALDGAPFGIRTNVVNPDAVLSESSIWQGEWASQRAAEAAIRRPRRRPCR